MASTQKAIRQALLDILAGLTVTIPAGTQAFGGTFRTRPSLPDLDGKICVWVDPRRIPRSERAITFPVGQPSFALLDRQWGIYLAVWSNATSQATRDLLASMLDEWTDAIEERVLTHVQGGVQNPISGTSIRYMTLADVIFDSGDTADREWYLSVTWVLEFNDKLVYTAAA
jgi:hypothetical protein